MGGSGGSLSWGQAEVAEPLMDLVSDQVHGQGLLLPQVELRHADLTHLNKNSQDWNTEMRSPKEILEKKAEMVKVGKADTANVDEQAVENEIRVKLFHLDMIRRLKEGSRVRKAEGVCALVLGIKDMKDKIEQAKILIKSGEEQQEMMMWQVVEARQELANQKMAMSDSMEVQARTVKNCQAMLMTYQTQLASASAQARLATPEVGVDIAGQATSCTQFSSVFCLSGWPGGPAVWGGAGQQVGGGQAGDGAAPGEELGQDRAQPSSRPDQAHHQHQLQEGHPGPGRSGQPGQG